MKISNMTQWQAMERMGSEASDAEAEEMLAILRASGHEDTDEITVEQWVGMISEAVAAVNGGAQ